MGVVGAEGCAVRPGPADDLSVWPDCALTPTALWRRPTALLVRVYSETADTLYRSPLDETYRPLLAQWQSWAAQHKQTEKAVWAKDKHARFCEQCSSKLGLGSANRRRHHCRACGGVFCADCSSRKLLDVAGYVHAKAQRVCDGCFDAMTSLGSLEQRRPDLVMISPGKTAAAVAAAADAISSERWQVGAELEVYSKKTETWRSGEIRSLPDEDMVEVVYTIDVPEPDTPRLKLCLRSSERLRWPKEEELLTITVRHERLHQAPPMQTM